jgi:hypothetical protein
VSSPNPAILTLTDPDGDTLELKTVGGMGEDFILIAVVQEGEFSGINLTLDKARQLRDSLDELIVKYDQPNAPGHQT